MMEPPHLHLTAPMIAVPPYQDTTEETRKNMLSGRDAHRLTYSTGARVILPTNAAIASRRGFPRRDIWRQKLTRAVTRMSRPDKGAKSFRNEAWRRATTSKMLFADSAKLSGRSVPQGR